MSPTTTTSVVTTTSAARRLEGASIAREIREAVAEDVLAFTAEQGRPPGLAVVIIGRDAPSTVYLEQILRGCEKVGIAAIATDCAMTACAMSINENP